MFMLNTLKSKFLILPLLASLALPACRGNFSIPLAKKEYNYIYPEIGLRGGADIPIYHANISKKLQTIPPHPDDGHFLKNPTTTKIEDELFIGFEPFLGLQAALNIGNTKLKTGGDGRLNFFSLAEGYRSGMFSVATETRKGNFIIPMPSAESYAFTQISMGPISPIPFVGLEQKILKSFNIDFELGFPYNNFEFKAGNDRYGKWDVKKKDEDGVFGIRGTGKISFCPKHEKSNNKEKLLKVGIGIGYEEYLPKFLGEKSSIRNLMPFVYFEIGF